MAKQKPRLKDIAEKTGYGTNTVSLALRGSTRISAFAREKISKAAKELDYIPNHIAKSLASQRSHTIGLILHEINNPMLTSAAEKIQRSLAARGYDTLFGSSNGSFEEELRAIEAFRARMIDGLLIYPVRHFEIDHLKQLRAGHFPIVLLVGSNDPEIDSVGIDEHRGAFDATQHLVQEGHRRIGILTTPQFGTSEKFMGYREALAAAGIALDPEIVGIISEHSVLGGIQATDMAMGAPDRPTAIFASSDVLALGALRWARVHGFEVPHDLAIIGFDDLDAARHAVTPLSTITNDVDDLAQRSVSRLMDLIETPGALPKPRSDPARGRLMVRESTRAAAKIPPAAPGVRRIAAGRGGGAEISLFDGKSLAGWHAVPRIPAPQWPGDPMPTFDPERMSRVLAHRGRWTVEDGAICGRQDPPGGGLGAYLLSDDTFGDFELIFEARPDWPADTGIMLRATPIGSQGYQVLLDHRKSGNIGGFYGNGIGRFHAINFNVDVVRDAKGLPAGIAIEDPATTIEPITAEKRALLTHAATGETFLNTWKWGDWNEFRITIHGDLPKITTAINGTLIAEIDTALLPASVFDPAGTLALLGREGHIGFEVHDNDPRMGKERWAPNAACRWRNIRLRPL
jgi:LacI family transcriptional regulator, galactose operon repressor